MKNIKYTILISIIFFILLTYQNYLIREKNRDLILEKNKTAELVKYSDSLQVARAIIVEQKDLVTLLKEDRTLYNLIKKQREEIAILVTNNSNLILENLTLTNIIGEQVTNIDGSVSQTYSFSHRPDNNLTIDGYTTVVYADSLAKPITSTTSFKEISFRNIKIDFAHTYNKDTQKYHIYAKTDYPYLTLDSTSVTYSIAHTNIIKPKNFGVLLSTGVFRNFEEKKQTTGVDLGLGIYYKTLSTILTGRSDQTLGLTVQKRF